jgi:3D (Asp-Asp-Asp) domain-containing protein
MQHGDLKTLLWGKHLSRMLGVCGVRHLPSDPAPRIVHPVPHWYQRLAGILTIAGLVATVHLIDTALRYQSEPSPWWDGTQAAAFDTTAWTRWTSSNSADAQALPAEDQAIPTGSQAPPTSFVAASASRWMPLTRSTLPVVRRRTKTILGAGQRFQSIDVTAYTSSRSETDSSPNLTASNTTPKPGTIALSRDLLRTFTPGAPFDFGDKVLIPGVGVFEAHDTMHPRWKEKADIWFTTEKKARAWGHRRVFVTEVGDNIPTRANPLMADKLR